jgi:hypothetical protein
MLRPGDRFENPRNESAAFGVADATGSETFAAGLPHVLQRSVIAPLGARVARVRGYELHLPS